MLLGIDRLSRVGSFTIQSTSLCLHIKERTLRLIIIPLCWSAIFNLLGAEETRLAGLVWLSVAALCAVAWYFLTIYTDLGAEYQDFWGRYGKVAFVVLTLLSLPIVPYTIIEWCCAVNTLHNRSWG